MRLTRHWYCTNIEFQHDSSHSQELPALCALIRPSLRQTLPGFIPFEFGSRKMLLGKIALD
ncbi:hypothetical protein D554_2065 [Bordetella holmesii 30539]|uniref:N-acetyltransferase YedL n=1 Tax=Bordetella holmesii 1058 TaxID=1247648 RepID=A0ABN0S0S6_9BORD|nr:hypothetical protein D560_0644 [Bordetella holmesii ATCC 51541]AIT25319.1 hypothetical protein D558_0633 [Bordetella holmesii 44057]EWM45884.1 hypothetical protein D557_3895 [Bordetella holmesii 70147]EWM48627.1 hypothetical protein D556_0639 [Bordetella holmesii 41130]EWM50014.1 hypothetical protein D555_0645 [Bordetella holmesii 35009]EXF86815.1 hypothetical protein D554_2065 [Bordetella holmesii 30539]EXX95160.1 hypothetical protein D559_2590 [Bordetella holmesii 1058]KAK99883.1 hypoth